MLLHRNHHNVIKRDGKLEKLRLEKRSAELAEKHFYCECFSDFRLFVCVGMENRKKRNLGRSHSDEETLYSEWQQKSIFTSFHPPPPNTPNAARYHSKKMFSPCAFHSCCCEYPVSIECMRGMGRERCCVRWKTRSVHKKKTTSKFSSPSPCFFDAFPRESENVRMACYIYQAYTHHSWAHRRENVAMPLRWDETTFVLQKVSIDGEIFWRGWPEK